MKRANPRCGRLLKLAGMASLMAVSACSAGPDYHLPQPAALGVPAQFSVLSDQSRQASHLNWWDSFGDAELTRLESEGLRANLDLAVALSRLRQSREALVQARSGNLPSLSATGGYSRNQAITGTSVSGNNLSLAVDASYQVDIFGGRRRGVEAARADAQASRFDYGAVVLTIQSEIAGAYLQVRLQQANLANARMTQSNQADNLQIAGWRNQAGLISSLDVELARTQLAQTTAAIPVIESNLNQSMARLGVLLGREPGALKGELAAAMPIPAGPASLAVGLPADLLRQRPDVRASERALAAATARIGVAQAQLYPALSLGGTIGAGASSFKNLLDVISGQAFANIAQTLFDGGRLHSQLRSQRAAADGAFASYKQTVLLALEDTENAVVALDAANRRQVQYAAALEAANNSALLARQQYRSGLIDYLTLLTSENLLVTSRNGLAQARYDHAAALVQLYTALGGGWDAQAMISGQDK